LDQRDFGSKYIMGQKVMTFCSWHRHHQTLNCGHLWCEKIHLHHINQFKQNKHSCVFLFLLFSVLLHQDGIISLKDIDLVMSEGLGMRYAFIGPMETIHLNAPEGNVSPVCYFLLTDKEMYYLFIYLFIEWHEKKLKERDGMRQQP